MPKSTTSTVRLNKFIALCGVASRRKADEMIENGQVQVNGKKVYELGVQIDPNNDRIVVDGKPIQQPHQTAYILFHKPKRVLTTMSDPENRPNVGEYFADFPLRVFPVGRLDWDSEGMILLTNDGEFANMVTHPKNEIPKTYLAKLDGKPRAEQLNKLLRGVSIIGGRVKAKEIELIKKGEQHDWVRIVITEGKNHQVRQMFLKIGFDVLKLKRVQIGHLMLGTLAPGEFHLMSNNEIQKIFEKDRVKETRPTSLKRQTSVKRQTSTKRPISLKRQTSTKRNPQARAAQPKR